MEFSEMYRFDPTNNSLYKLEGNAYLHCAKVPFKIKTLRKAVLWFESLE